jgi:flagellar biogenesis protein FliO
MRRHSGRFIAPVLTAGLLLAGWSAVRAAETPTTAPAQSAAAQAGPVPHAAATDAAAPKDLNHTEIHRPGNAAPTDGDKNPAAPPQSSSMELGRVVLALSAVVGLIFALRWGSRKILALPSAGNSSHLMRVIARTPLAPKQSVMLLRVGQRLMVVGDSAGNLSSLGQITDPDEVATLLGQAKATSPSMAPTNFGGVLKKLSRKFRGDHSQESEEEIETTDADSRTERTALLGEPEPADADRVELSSAPPQVGLDEKAAQEAVEAARRDVATLREKLREVSQRITGGNGTAAAAETSGGPVIDAT